VLAADPRGKVVGIADGDTLTILADGQQTKVRLWGIDAPERKQPFGNASKKRLAELCHGKEVSVETRGQDRHGRTLGIVTVGENVNLRMVQDGYAWHYVRYAPDAKDYAAAEKEAREAKRGLWQQEAVASIPRFGR
jgi:endonuclease YncB( thermonuclease family)